MKKICLFLALIILLLPCASCGGGVKTVENPEDAQNPDQAGENAAGPAGGPAAEKILPDVPEKDYGGYEFTILANSLEYSSHWYSRDIYVEGENGDAIDDAVYYRNRAIEERYNVTIKGAFSRNQYGDAKKSVSSGDGTYDVLTVPMQGASAQLAQEGLLFDLKNVPYIDLDKPWWDQRATGQVSVGNRLMFTISDLLVMDKDALFIYLFNKDLIQEMGMDDPYQLVRDNKWVIDKFWDMARTATADLNGDGAMDDGDRYGLISQTHTIHGNVAGSGYFAITKDKDDMPEINIADPMIQESYAKWIDIHNDRTNTIIAQDWTSKYTGDTIWDQQLGMLVEKRALWHYTGMNRVTMAREMEGNFGILPNPKFSESQSEYHNAVYAGCTTAVSIPVTSDPERTGIILEALTGESYYTLRPAYYDVSLKHKLMRDDESGEMLDLIFATRCYDLGQVYNWGGIFDIFANLALKKSTDFVSEYEKIMPRIEKDMQKFLDNFLD